MWTRIRVLCILATAVGFIAVSDSASAEVVPGTIVSVNSSGTRLVVKLRGKETNRALRLSSDTRVLIDGKSGSARRLKPGQSVYAFIKESYVTRLNVKSAVQPTADPKPKKTTSGSTFGSPKASTSKSPDTTTGSAPRTESTATGSRTSSRSSARSRRFPTKPAESDTIASSSSGDWNQFRGPNRDNLSPERGLLASWPDQGPPQAWTARGIGEGYSAVSISNGRVYTMGNVGQEEKVMCLDLESGREIWSTVNGRAFQQNQGDGPRGTPAIVDGRVYSLGANGDLSCLDAQTGQQQWRKNILQEFGGENIHWGLSESVLVDGDKVICTPGGRRATMVALNRNTGSVIWTAAVPSSPKASYASPIAIDVGGVRQYVNYTHGGVIGVRASDGRVMWGHRQSSNGTANCSTPVFYDGSVFTASGYDTGGALFRLQSRSGQTVSQVAYTTKDMKNHHGGMVVLNGYLYGSSDPGILKCIELRSNRTVWQNRSVGKGAVSYADGHLYVRSEQGPVALVAATPDGYEEKGRFNQPQRSNKSSWSHPVIADGKLFLRDMDTLLAYDIRAN